MSPQYLGTVAALKTVAGLTVIKTSWLASRKEYPLPAVVVDIENPIFDSVTEDGTLQEIATRMSLVFFVKKNDVYPESMIEDLENQAMAAVAAIGAAYSDKQIRIDLPQIDMMPFGKDQTTLGMGFFLTISDGDQ